MRVIDPNIDVARNLNIILLVPFSNVGLTDLSFWESLVYIVANQQKYHWTTRGMSNPSKKRETNIITGDTFESKWFQKYQSHRTRRILVEIRTRRILVEAVEIEKRPSS